MKIVKVVYDDATKYILDIIKDIKVKIYLEEYNYSITKDKKKAIPIMTRHGTKNLPLVVFENENIEEYAAIWSESSPDWLEEINKILNLPSNL
jgi:hypothetical protein